MWEGHLLEQFLRRGCCFINCLQLRQPWVKWSLLLNVTRFNVTVQLEWRDNWARLNLSFSANTLLIYRSVKICLIKNLLYWKLLDHRKKIPICCIAELMNNNDKVLSQRIQFASQVYSRMRHNKEFMKHIVLIFF